MHYENRFLGTFRGHSKRPINAESPSGQPDVLYFLSSRTDDARDLITPVSEEDIEIALQGPVVQKPINANLGLNLLKLGLNFNPRLLCVVQS